VVYIIACIAGFDWERIEAEAAKSILGLLAEFVAVIFSGCLAITAGFEAEIGTIAKGLCFAVVIAFPSL
jgi:hypothetical protein